MVAQHSAAELVEVLRFVLPIGCASAFAQAAVYDILFTTPRTVSGVRGISADMPQYDTSSACIVNVYIQHLHVYLRGLARKHEGCFVIVSRVGAQSLPPRCLQPELLFLPAFPCNGAAQRGLNKIWHLLRW